MADSYFDFLQIIEMSDNIFYKPISKGGKINITPDTYVTVWCENRHPTTERANHVYEHLMQNGLLFDCPVCKLVKEKEATNSKTDSKKSACEDCCMESMDPRQDETTAKIYLDFTCFFVLFFIILFYFAF